VTDTARATPFRFPAAGQGFPDCSSLYHNRKQDRCQRTRRSLSKVGRPGGKVCDDGSD
jgi:hypothetical protein